MGHFPFPVDLLKTDRKYQWCQKTVAARHFYLPGTRAVKTYFWTVNLDSRRNCSDMIWWQQLPQDFASQELSSRSCTKFVRTKFDIVSAELLKLYKKYKEHGIFSKIMIHWIPGFYSKTLDTFNRILHIKSAPGTVTKAALTIACEG